MKAVSGVVDQKIKDANAYAETTRDDLEKVLKMTNSEFVLFFLTN